MKIITRNGETEEVRLDEITERIRKACSYCNNLDNRIDPVVVSMKVCNSIRDNITTSELDEVTARICMNLSLENPDWGNLGSRIIVSNHQKNTKWSFSQAMSDLYHNKDRNGESCPLVSTDVYELSKIYEHLIKPERDFLIDFFGFKTLEKSYLLKTNEKIIRETPQYLWLRVAIGIWGKNEKKVENTYNLLSQKFFTHATPTLFNAGTPRPGMLSCFLLGTEDSVDGIYKTISDCAKISKWAGGIGIHVSNIRCKDSYIRGTGGKTSGIIPMLKVYNHTARYIDQAGKRKGSFAIYLEPHHGDIFDFLKAMRNHGNEESLARDLFYALWIPDCFMEAVKQDDWWYLMCPDECPGLPDCYGEDFEKLYFGYVEQEKYRRKVKAREVWDEILKSQIESGLPYIGYKDHVNRKCNQNNLGVIKSLNLCIEITEYSDSKEYACCFTKDTKILTSTGIKDIIDCDNEMVFSYFKNDKNFEKTQHFEKAKLVCNGKKEVYEIKTFGDTPIKATKNHPFLVLERRNKNTKINKYKWKNVNELEIGDKIINPRIDTIPEFLNSSAIENEDTDFQTAGWIMGDGWLSKYGWGVCFGAHEIYAQDIVLNKLNEFHQSVLKIGNGKFASKVPGVCKKGNRWVAIKNQKRIGYFDKEIEAIEAIEAIGKIDKSDFYYNVSKYTQPNGVVNWQSSKGSFKQILKDKFGFYQVLGKHKKITEKIKNSTPNQQANFLSGIWSADGCVYEDKRGHCCLSYTSASKELLKDIHNMLLPFGIKSKYRHGEVKCRKGRFQGTVRIHDLKSKENFLKYIGFLLCPEKHNKLEFLLQQDIEKRERIPRYSDYSKIKSITKIGFETVYDLCLSDSHNFLANGLVVHNCNLISLSLPSFLKVSSNFPSTRYDIIIYTKPNCVWCDLIKVFFRQNLSKNTTGCIIHYNANSEEVLENFKNTMGITVYPKVFVSEDGIRPKLIGGFEDTVAYFRPEIDYSKLEEVVGTAVDNLNKIIDINYYPVPETKISNLKHRPIGIGVQGLADLFAKMWIIYDSDCGRKINKLIFEAIYYYAMKKSLELSKINESYSSFNGSMLSEGKFQFDLWGVKPSGNWDWESLRKDVVKFGTRNSLLVALMPTASTAQILGNNESFEPISSNMFVRRTLSGEFIVINKYLMNILHQLDLWNEEMKYKIMYHKGSIQNIKEIPSFIRDMYKTVWEIKKKTLIDMMADRGAYVDQSASFNLYAEECTPELLTKCHLHSFNRGLKTGCYYIRSRPACDSQSFTIDPSLEKKFKQELLEKEKEVCEMCSA